MTRFSKNGISFYSWNVFSRWNRQLTAVMTTRGGGVSSKPFKSLNMGHLLDDDKRNVEKNRKLVSEALGLTGMPWACTHQVHGTCIKKAEAGRPGTGENCDSLYLNQKGIISSIVLADCLPVLVYDPHRHEGIISHAGWKGTAARIAEKSVNYLLDSGSRVEDLTAAVGPGIGPCCYPVGEETAEYFTTSRNYPKGVIIRDRDKTIRLNLEEANISQLRNCGLLEDRIGAAGFCTACRNDEFYSYRKERGHTGRHAALMVLL